MQRIWKQYKPLFISLLISLGIGALSALFIGDATAYYNSLKQPPFAPPSWVFPVVWSILYILMGISAYLIYRSNAPYPKKAKALMIYGLQLVVNFLWSVFFFRFHWLLFSFVWLLFLLALIMIMIALFYRIDKRAALLQIPYLIWVAFAGYLNLAIYLLNG